jgi:membrane protein YqaA with SNARE-associated domain
VGVQRFFSSVFLLFLSPVGLVALAALDSSMIFFLPTAVEAAVVILTARNREIAWLFPLLATAGSVMGAVVTLLIGAKIGEKGIRRWLPGKRLQSVQETIRKKGSRPLAMSGLMPPPFPLSAFVLACGALGVSKSRFLVAFGIARLIRFAIVATFAFFYGRWILRIMESDKFQFVLAIFAVVVIVGTAFSIYGISRKRGVHS